MNGKRIVLILGGGIAVYKVLELIRRLREKDICVRPVMTQAAHEFITPLSVGALSGETVYSDLFDLTAERDIGHIRLSRETDMIVVAPATAHLLARMAHGLADDLATNILLATNKAILVAPAMNPRMWLHPATQRNVTALKQDGVHFIGPNVGKMAEQGEEGPGRLVEPHELLDEIQMLLIKSSQRPSGGLTNRHVLITSGPTHEAIDPVRYIANRSSGKQGHAIAEAAVAAGAKVTLISGPVALPDPAGVNVIHVETADEMLNAVRQALPADIGIFAAAVADWRVETIFTDKMKKKADGTIPNLTFVENPDIVATIAHNPTIRPKLVIGFAAETNQLLDNAQDKLKRKKLDWIIANDVSPQSGVMGGDKNKVSIVSTSGIENWPKMDKSAVAEKLIIQIADHFK